MQKSLYVLSDEEEDEVTPPDVDDRCESDISGVAADTEDWSGVSEASDELLVLRDGRHVYCHQPNRAVNSTLTAVTVVVALLAIGIGIGHFIGESLGAVANFIIGFLFVQSLNGRCGGERGKGKQYHELAKTCLHPNRLRDSWTMDTSTP